MLATVFACGDVTLASVVPPEHDKVGLPNFRRVLRGDKGQLNGILAQAKAVIPGLEDFGSMRMSEWVGPRNKIEIVMKIYVGDNNGGYGTCKDFRLNGDIIVEGVQKPNELRNRNEMQRYDISFLANGIQVRCDIPLKVKIEEVCICNWFPEC